MPSFPLLALLFLAVTSGRASGQVVLDLLDGETLYDGGSLLSIGASLQRGEELRRGGDRIDDPADGAETRLWSNLTYQYGLRHDLQVGASLMYADLDQSGTGFERGSSGLGDLDLIAKWRVFRADAPGRAFNLALIGNLSVPTGKDDASDMGQRLEPELQTGRGSFDPGIGFGATHEPGRWRFNAAAHYRWRTDSDGDGWRVGDQVFAELAAGNRFWLEPYPGPFMRADVALRYRQQDSSRGAGQWLPDTGAERATVALNLAFRPRPSLDFQLELEAPFWQRVNGTQYGTDWALGFSFGYRY